MVEPPMKPQVTLSQPAMGALIQLAGWRDSFESAATPILQRLGFAGIGDFGRAQVAGDALCFRVAPERVLLRMSSLVAWDAIVSGVDPALYVRDYQGSPDLLYRDTALSAETYMGCGAIFTAGLAAVQAAKGNDGGPPDTLSDPYYLPDTSRIKQIYREIYPDAFKLKVPNWQTTRTPDAAILRELLAVAGSSNAVAFIDPFGNLVLCLGEGSGIDTAFMQVTSQYAQRRFMLREEDELSMRYLTQPAYGAFVYLYAPDPKDARTIMSFGAYGSSMAGPIPEGYQRNFLYYRLPAGVTQADLDSAIAALPPFYNQTVKMALAPV